MPTEIPAGAFAIKDCGCVVIAEWFDEDKAGHAAQRWRNFQAKAKRYKYAIETFAEKPTRDWLCGPHRAGHETYKQALAEATN